MQLRICLLFLILMILKQVTSLIYNKPINRLLLRMSSTDTTTLQTLKVYWRGDPNTNAKAPTNDNWPRNGALLKGYGPFKAKGEDWFKVVEIQQAGTSGFKTVPEGTWMMYNQNGPLLRNL